MARVTCSVCGANVDSKTIHNCPECNSYVCPKCYKLYNGYCKDCFDDYDSNDIE